MRSKTKQILEQLMNSDEYNTDAAIPNVAYQAVDEINHLVSVHSEEVQALKDKVEKLKQFITDVSELKMWGYDKDDGTPYEESEEPGEGYEDSHTCLMNFIEEARNILKSM